MKKTIILSLFMLLGNIAFCGNPWACFLLLELDGQPATCLTKEDISWTIECPQTDKLTHDKCYDWIIEDGLLLINLQQIGNFSQAEYTVTITIKSGDDLIDYTGTMVLVSSGDNLVDPLNPNEVFIPFKLNKNK